MPCLGLGWYGPKEEDILIVDGSGGSLSPRVSCLTRIRCARQDVRVKSAERRRYRGCFPWPALRCFDF